MSVRAQVLAALESGPKTNAEIAGMTTCNPKSIAAACSYLRQYNLITSSMVGKGFRPTYALPRDAHLLGQIDQAPAPSEVVVIVKRVDRDPCPYCAVRRDYGCRHFPRELVAA